MTLIERPVENDLPVLAFFAHPDDETMLAGGILALLARQGAQVYYLCATRGEGGENGEPPLCALDALGAVREQEMRCAVDALGAAGLAFLDYIDPRVGADNTLYAYCDDVDTLAQQVREAVLRWNIGAVITHGSNGEYGHPAHLITHQAARLAVPGLGECAPLLYSSNACFPGHPKPRLANKDDDAHLVVDISPVLAQKTAAALCHATQHALFVRNASKEAGRPMRVEEVIVNLESLHRHLPAASGRVDDPLAALLRASGQVREA